MLLDVYVLLILIRGELVLGTGALEYPYYFLDAHTNGYLYVIIYLLVVNVIFIALGYLFWAYDKLIKNKENKLIWDFSPLPKPEPQNFDNKEIVINEKEEIVDNNEN